MKTKTINKTINKFRKVKLKRFNRLFKNYKPFDDRKLHPIKYDYKFWTKFNYLKASYNRDRFTSTYKYQLISKKRKIENNNILKYILFWGGLSRSIGESCVLVNSGYIKVNGIVVKNANKKIDTGSVIINTHPTSLFTYFIHKYHNYIPTTKKHIKYKKLNEGTLEQINKLKTIREKSVTDISWKEQDELKRLQKKELRKELKPYLRRRRLLGWFLYKTNELDLSTIVYKKEGDYRVLKTMETSVKTVLETIKGARYRWQLEDELLSKKIEKKALEISKMKKEDFSKKDKKGIIIVKDPGKVYYGYKYRKWFSYIYSNKEDKLLKTNYNEIVVI